MITQKRSASQEQKENVRLRKMVGTRGFEPPTPKPPAWCANQAALRSVLDRNLKYLVMESFIGW
jgi:hypothetical protein